MTATARVSSHKFFHRGHLTTKHNSPHDIKDYKNQLALYFETLDRAFVLQQTKAMSNDHSNATKVSGL